MDEKKRQKKLAKQKKKRKEKVSSIRVEKRVTLSMSPEMVARLPIHECYVAKRAFETGMGTVVVSRKLNNGQIAMGMFLLDLWCLGVKNCFFRVCSAMDFKTQMDGLNNNEPITLITPEHARKLVEECAAYAEGLGFEPHEEYEEASYIFGNIDASKCNEKFEFGSGGQPLYVAGPDEDEDDMAEILLQIKSKNEK